MNLYAENIIDHYRHPRCYGIGKECSYSHSEKNLSCGDAVTVYVHIENDVLQNIQWQGSGCAISQAAISMLCEELEGKPVSEVTQYTPQDIYTLLGVPISQRRMKCALIGLLATKNAIQLYRNAPVQSWIDLMTEENTETA